MYLCLCRFRLECRLLQSDHRATLHTLIKHKATETTIDLQFCMYKSVHVFLWYRYLFLFFFFFFIALWCKAIRIKNEQHAFEVTFVCQGTIKDWSINEHLFVDHLCIMEYSNFNRHRYYK